MNSWNNSKKETVKSVIYSVNNNEYSSYEEAVSKAMKLPCEEVTINKKVVISEKETSTQTIENTLFKELMANNVAEIEEIISRVRSFVVNATTIQLLELMTENTYRIMCHCTYGGDVDYYSLLYVKNHEINEDVKTLTEKFRAYVLNLLDNFPKEELRANMVEVYSSDDDSKTIPYISIPFKCSYRFTQTKGNLREEVRAISNDPRLYGRDNSGAESGEPDFAYLLFSGIEKRIHNNVEKISGLKIEVLKGYWINDRHDPIADLTNTETKQFIDDCFAKVASVK